MAFNLTQTGTHFYSLHVDLGHLSWSQTNECFLSEIVQDSILLSLNLSDQNILSAAAMAALSMTI